MAGHRQTVVLLHGLYSSSLEWQFIAKKLNEAGHTVIVPHLPGYSVTGSAMSHSNRWEDWLITARNRIDSILKKHPTISIGGLCIGANLALMLSAEYKERIDRLFLLSTTLFYDGWGLPWYKFLLPLAYYTPAGRLYSYREREPFGVKNPKMRRLVARQMEQRHLSAAGAARLQSCGLYQANQLIRAVKKIIPAVTAPAAIYHATEDDMTSLRSVHYLERHLGSSEQSTMLLHDSYHMITLDNERELVANHMLDMLSHKHIYNSAFGERQSIR